jgi:hypothetical protein
MTKESATAEGWIALPGLFEHTEIAGITDLQIRAQPLVIVGQRTLYGVYVREIAHDGSDRETSGVRTIDLAAVAALRKRLHTG